MKQKFTFRIIIVLGIIFCLWTIDATASTGEAVNISYNAAAAVVLALVIMFGLKVVAKNLKRVDKDLNDSFGEKVLP